MRTSILSLALAIWFAHSCIRKAAAPAMTAIRCRARIYQNSMTAVSAIAN
jgi:hypothetical protein